MDETDMIERLLTELERCAQTVHDPELCRQMPCLGTPGDIARLIRAGYGDMLCRGEVIALEQRPDGELVKHRLPMVQLQRRDGGCVMHKDGKCLLRLCGLTPTQGRILGIVGELPDKKLGQLLMLGVIARWADPANLDLVRYCIRSVEEERQEPPA